MGVYKVEYVQLYSIAGCNRLLYRIEPHSKASNAESSLLTMRRKDNAHGTDYRSAHDCGELSRQLVVCTRVLQQGKRLAKGRRVPKADGEHGGEEQGTASLGLASARR